MEPGLFHVLRWALYIDMGLMFGMPAIAWATGGRDMLKPWRALPVFGAMLCVPLSVFGFLAGLSEMAAMSLGSLDHQLILTLLTGSALGLAMIARCLAALCFLTLDAIGWTRAATIAGAAAVTTLAWSGHGGASEGWPGIVRLAADMLHLLAASAWIGALILFLLALLKVRRREADAIMRVGRLLSAFALPGSILVATLILTGLSNMLFIAPPSAWPRIAGHPYGEAMLVKLALFIGMLLLATVNRFVIVPRLIGRPVEARAVDAARLTIGLEAAAGLAIFALVTWLGSLDPGAAWTP